MISRPRALLRLLALVALVASATGCSALGLGSSPTPDPVATLSPCQSAVNAAAIIAKGKRQPGDLDVALALCPTAADFTQAASLYPAALAGENPLTFIDRRCDQQRSLAGAQICAALALAAPSPNASGAPAVLPPGHPAPGQVLFGKALGADGVSVASARTAFKRTTTKIAFAALLADVPPDGKAQLQVWRKDGTGEHVVWQAPLTVDGGVDGQARDLAKLVGRKAGVYVVRYLVDGLPAAQGTFSLSK